MSALIHFRCDNPLHAGTDEAPGQLTIHAKTWAYCAEPEMREDHNWVAVAPASFESFRRVRVKERPGAASRH